jgi:hypothetical protein
MLVALPQDRFERLLRLVNKPNGKHSSGGYQSRNRRWRSSIDEAARTIAIEADDLDWIRRQLQNRDGGGWQKHVYDIFNGVIFTDLPVTPRRPFHMRRHRRPPDQRQGEMELNPQPEEGNTEGEPE